jgi:hypothetical protein
VACARWSIVLAALSGCAGGAPSNKGPAATSVGSTVTVGGETDGGDPPSETSDAEDGSADDGASSSESSSSGAESSSSAGGESSSDDGAPAMCTQDATCATATVIGMVSGDKDSDPLQIMGTEPTWVTFQVTEDDDSIAGENVSFTATLDSPGGADFDLYVYRGPSNGTTGCNGMADDSTSSAAQDVVHMSWGEGGVANGGDDRAWIAVEIVPKVDCDGIAMWTLTIEGDT